MLVTGSGAHENPGIAASNARSRKGQVVAVSADRVGSFQVTTVRLGIPELPAQFNGYKILQLTDLHYGPATPLPLIREAVTIGQSLSPDLIALTGDYIQISSLGVYHILATRVHPRMFRWTEYRRHVRDYTDQLAEALAPLTAPDGRIGTFGNHDYTEGVGTIRRRLGADITWLVNEQKLISRGDASISIAGTDDLRYGSPDLVKTFTPPVNGTHAPASACILLSHNPDIVLFRNKELLANADIMLSGHTHGGQLCFPGVRPLVTRTKQKTHVRGLSTFGSTPIYVTNGVGFGGVSLRVFCPAELLLLQLESI